MKFKIKFYTKISENLDVHQKTLTTIQTDK